MNIATLYRAAISSTGSTRAGEDAVKQTPDPDIVVVGGGLAGMVAALAAAERGASVVVLDRAYGGGATAISGGVVYAGGGTRQQAAAGYGGDTADNMFRYLGAEVGDAVDAATLRRFCDGSVARMAWLERHGVAFAGSLCPFRTSYPTSEYFLYFSGNEKAHPFAALADPAPRGHRAVGEGTGGMGMTGAALWQAVFDAAVRLGVVFRPASRVEALLLDDAGAVSGVRYRALDETSGGFARHKSLVQRASGYHQISMQTVANWFDLWAESIWQRESRERTMHSRAVILAAGGFVMNEEMLSGIIPWARRVSPLGTAGDDGSGIKLGQSVGGTVSHMDRVSAWRLIYPPEALVEGIVVSPGGERIAAEDLYGASFSEVMIDRFDGHGYLILDSTQWKKVKDQVNSQTQMPWKAFILYLLYWAHKKASSIEGLARKLRVDPGTIKSTVDAYNDAITNDKPDPVNKLSYRTVIEKGPFYGIDISLQPSGLLVSPALPLGGLRVDGETGLVLNEAGGTIKGLYAAGKNAVGVSSNRYISGLALADCIFSGKRAGEHA
ncbi:flavoprotein [Durotheca rogersii]|uniref:flavoprotein n=1 Tax=Durotheca rogersii TaxID=419775 RepID=UPI00222094E5|nr:flavoprotein [Durotheca rogersii]KAI5857350.1 flavoprotein [Durotheca rogersii]